jgi:hypothetical protein
MWDLGANLELFSSILLSWLMLPLKRELAGGESGQAGKESADGRTFVVRGGRWKVVGEEEEEAEEEEEEEEEEEKDKEGKEEYKRGKNEAREEH